MLKKYRFLNPAFFVIPAFFFPVAAFAAETPGPSIQDQAASLWELIAAGGSCMILQGLLSVAAVALIIHHFRYVKVETMVPADFCDNLFVLLEKKEYEKAASMCKQQENLVSSIMAGALKKISKSKVNAAQIENTLQIDGKGQVEKLWQNLTYLGDIAVVAPLVGLLGTVLGMINAFHYFKSGSIHPGVLTQGLAKAMVNTVAGLIVAVICLVFYAYFRSRVSAVTARAESVTTDIAQILSR